MGINRRKFLRRSLLPAILIGASPKSIVGDAFKSGRRSIGRARPGDPAWPSPQKWEELGRLVHGNLMKLDSPFTLSKANPDGEVSKSLFTGLKNPYYIGDNPSLTQTVGWLDAWQCEASAYAIAARDTGDIVAAVNFARENNLRLVIKGGGHSYQGGSNAADSLLVWTKAMNKVVLHDHFVGDGCDESTAQPAVTIDAGVLWLQAYDEVTTNAGRYVQGGGCTTVGVAGLILGGGFGSYSKHYGLAAAALLEAEIVMADGSVKKANASVNPDLFWALKGGGGGSFGVVTRLTVRTRELPTNFGAVFGAIRANNDTAFKSLLTKFISFYQAHLFNPHWGEQINITSDNSIEISMLFHGLTQPEATVQWKPFQDWLLQSGDQFTITTPINILAIPARNFWNPVFLKKYAAAQIAVDDRAGAPAQHIYWMSNKLEAGQYLTGYHSVWLPQAMLEKSNQPGLADALFNASREWSVGLHFNKGLAGSPAEEVGAARQTAMNPAVLDAFALAIIAGQQPPAYKGVAGHEPDFVKGRRQADTMERMTAALMHEIPAAGSYLSESNYFDKNWQQSHWGSNYERLLTIKRKYDPDGLFYVHHGVGSEDWTDNGFTRK